MAREAQAGCGEYVLINGRPASMYHQSVSRTVRASLPSLPNSGRPATRLPCDGPQCGNQIPLPIPADLPTLQLRGAEQWASLLDGRESPEARWSAACPREQCSWQEVSISPLDRPPRD